jgi:flagellar operon protein (TIGR03826 family)
VNYRNCSRCGKLFIQVGQRTICPDCVREDDKSFDVIRDYLYDHPGAGVVEVSERTGIDEQLVLQFLRDGRLVLGQGVADSLRCERCGAQIRTGRLCDRCLASLTSEVRRVTGTSQPRASQSPPAARTERDRLHIDQFVQDKRDGGGPGHDRRPR